MMDYVFKTRNNSSVQGKAKVYFCCYPDDFVNYWDMVCEEILNLVDVAIFHASYEDGMPKDPDGHFDALSEARLFVVPVTSDLLLEDSFACEEIAFAKKKHIPILPLMQEKGLESEFSRVFDNIQFLYNNVEDDTALSYESKLKTFLESILFGDELLQKIRAAFDAYVFLSYRKKDRRYAKELMTLIHQNELCRDIAIWYDEFLVPGENFDHAIEEMLKKSDFFALVVTPNLVKELNYVMTVEYPMAIEQKKPIISVEFEDTDRDLLKAHYENISPVWASAETVGSRFSESLRALAIAENDSSPEHCFFIGLAYLGGIDVEVNYERAISLITYAAEHGVTEAAQKLVSVYWNGDGVARSFDESIRWQEKLIEMLYEKAEKENDVLLRCDLIKERVTLIDMKEERNRRKGETEEDILQDAIAWLADSEQLRAIKTLCGIYISAAFSIKFSKTRREYVVTSLELARRYAEREGGEEGRLNLAKAYYFASYLTNDEAYCHQAIALLEQLKEKADASVFSLFGELYSLLSDWCRQKKKSEQALLYAELALEQVKLGGDVTKFGSVCRSLGRLYADMKKPCEARHILSIGISYFLALGEKEKDRFYVRSFALLYEAISELELEQGDTEAAFSYAVEAVARYESLANEYPFGDYIKDAEKCVERYGTLFFEKEAYENAIWFFEKGISLHFAFLDQKRIKNYPFNAILRISKAYLALGNVSAAQEALLRMREALDGEFSSFWCGEWGVTLGELYQKQMRYEDSVIAFLLGAGGFTGEIHCQKREADAWFRAGELLLSQEKNGEAKACYWLAKKRYNEHESLFEKPPMTIYNKRLRSIAQPPEFEGVIRLLETEIEERRPRAATKREKGELSGLLYVTGQVYEMIEEKRKAFCCYRESVFLKEAFLLPVAALESELLLSELALRCLGDEAALDCLTQAEQKAARYFHEKESVGNTGGAFERYFGKMNAYCTVYYNILKAKGDILRSAFPEKAVASYELAEAIKTGEYYNPYDLHDLWLHLGECYTDLGEYEKAKAALAKEEEYLPYMAKDLIAFYKALCRLGFLMKDTALGERAYEEYKSRVTDEMEAAIEYEDEPKGNAEAEAYGTYLADWSELCRVRANVVSRLDDDFLNCSFIYMQYYRKRKNHKGLRTVYARCAATISLFMKIEPTEFCYEFLCALYGTEAELSYEAQDDDGYRSCLQAFIAHLEAYGAQMESNASKYPDLLALCYYRLAVSFDEEDDRELLQKAYEIWQDLALRYPQMGYEKKRDTVAELLS